MLQDQDNQKNLLLAIVLSVAVLLAWQFFYAGPKLKEEQERQARIRQEQQAKTKEQTPPGAPTTTPDVTPGKQGTVPGPSSVTTAANRDAAVGASPRIAIETPSIKGSIALKGGRIDDVVLAKYRETVDPGSPNVVLFSPSGAPQPYYAEYGWVAGAGVTQPMPNSETLWRAEKGGALTPGSPVTLVWDNGQGLIFRRTITVDENYLFTVADEVENKTSSAVSLHPYALISRHGMPKIEGFYILHEGPIGVLGTSRTAGAELRRPAEGWRFEDLQADRRLARVHRQVLGGRARPQSDRPQRSPLLGREGTKGHVPDRFLGRPRFDRARRQADLHISPVRRRQGRQSHRRLQRAARSRPVRPAGRLGLVPFHHQTPVQAAALARPVLRQLRPRHPRHHGAREARVLPAGQQELRVRWPR